MPAKRRLTMRQLRQMLRVAGSGTTSREIAVVLGVARGTVQDNLKRGSPGGTDLAVARRTDRRRDRASAFRPCGGQSGPAGKAGA